MTAENIITKNKCARSAHGRAAILALAFGVTSCVLAYAPAPVVFDTPAKDEKGIMVLGNG